ncbi:hypothetical protein OG749_31415 [Streptomyces nojiriensis]|uniref:hypothetical protein n=1 Tax=Streptomyces nojiriensis TaxID=66374 RepID=UPI002E181AB6
MSAPHPLVEQASALMDLERYDGARALLARRLGEEPTDVDGWVYLAGCHLSVRECEEVLTATGEVLALAPEDFDAHHMRTYALRRLGRPEEALAEAQETVRIDPQRWKGFAALSEALGAGSRAGPRRSTRRRPPYGSNRTRSARTTRCGRPRR